MKNSFNNRDFEQFVKQNADQYRMFPSEKVWSTIHNKLHTRNRWYAFGVALLLLTTGSVTMIMLMNPEAKKQQITTSSITAVSKNILSQEILQAQNPTSPAILVDAKIANETSVLHLKQNLFLAQQVNTIENSNDDTYRMIAEPATNTVKPLPVNAISNTPVSFSKVTPGQYKEYIIATPSTNSFTDRINSTNTLAVYDFAQKEMSPLSMSPGNEEKNNIITNKYDDIYPLTIESVINYYIQPVKRKKLSTQVYFLPTISYRKLGENKNDLLNAQAFNAPFNLAVIDGINNAVTHKPDIGLELGFNVGYPITKNLKLTTGLQFNVSKYDIKAYPSQREDARIVLNNANGSRSISTIETNYRAVESYTKPHWLSNFYFSASLPIGAELRVKRLNKDSYLGIGGTIQPTYILSERAYLISTDFKNYAKLPSLTRNFNINSSFEIFTGFSSGNVKWKIGPQIRYQVLSSFQKKYPVKEHLIDFGLKVGIMLNK